MQATFSRELADQRIAEFHRQAARDRLAREVMRARRAAARQALRALLRRAEVPARGAAGANPAGLAELRGRPGTRPTHPRSGEGA